MVYLEEDGSEGVSMPVAEIVKHEGYNYDNQVPVNDLALLRLETPVTFSKFIVPVSKF